MVGVVRASVGHIVEDVAALQAVLLCRSEEALGSEGPLGVDVETLAWKRFKFGSGCAAPLGYTYQHCRSIKTPSHLPPRPCRWASGR